ncbi:MAG TPA: hypothetical protein VHC70_03930, partial [Phycisphaerales bacterium]|nr:hypothetical protein [Phycisphaerales bacterium]
AAMPLFKRAYEIRSRSLAITANSRTKRDVAIAGSAYAVCLLSLSPPDDETAEPVLSQAFDLLSQLACSDPNDHRIKSDLVRSASDLALLHLTKNDSDAAVQWLNKAIDQGHDDDQASSGKDPVLAQELMRAHEQRGDIRRVLKDLSGARADYEQALKYAAQLGPELEGVADIQARLHKSIAELKTDR